MSKALKHRISNSGRVALGVGSAVALYLVLGLVLAAMGVCFGGCASTSVRYGPFAYQSDKNVSAQNVTYTRNADGSESFHADSLGGDPTAVNAGTVQAILAGMSIGRSLAPLPAPGVLRSPSTPAPIDYDAFDPDNTGEVTNPPKPATRPAIGGK